MKTPHDAVDLLKSDHKANKALFETYQALCDSEATGKERQAIAREICTALTVHCQIEEELFYPAVRLAIGNPALMNEAVVEHDGAKALIAQIMAMKPGDALYDARVKVLGEGVEHHVKEEHTRMFPLARKANLDLLALGARMFRRKTELMALADALVEDEDLDPVGRVRQPPMRSEENRRA